MTDKVPIRQLPTGVPGLDAVLGGGLPEFSFNLIAGAPGSGKTTLAQQIMFNLAEPARPALYFTVLGEPPVKMLRYQQQFTFFDAAKVNDSIRFINVAQEVLEGGLSQILKRIVQEVEAASPSIVVVDSFRTAVRTAEREPAGPLEMQHFVQQLGIHLTGWEATTFLVGEYLTAETAENPIFTVADGLLWLYQSVDRNSVVRKMQVVKMSWPGVDSRPAHVSNHRRRDTGLSTRHRRSRGEAGTGVFWRQTAAATTCLDRDQAPGRDAGRRDPGRILGARGGSVRFRQDGPGHGIPRRRRAPRRAGRPCDLREAPARVLADRREGKTRGRLVADEQIAIIQARPLDLSIDETLHELTKAIRRLKARRLVIDSLSGFELALAPTFREDFRESLYRMVTAITGMGVTVMMTAEVEDSYVDLRFSPHGTAFLTDAIIMQRYIELAGSVEAHHGRGQGARERTQEGAAGVRNHRGRHRRG